MEHSIMRVVPCAALLATLTIPSAVCAASTPAASLGTAVGASPSASASVSGESGPLGGGARPLGLDGVRGCWGDVDEDGYVTPEDADIVQQFIDDPSSLSAAQKERIRRYGDIAGTVNNTDVGNDVIDDHDTRRHIALAGGVIDPGTAGAFLGYGDVNGDGVADIVDSVLVARYRAGVYIDAGVKARIEAKGGGDISPTVPYISFGDGLINSEDVAAIRSRASRTESNPPAYVDYWPLHLTSAAHPEVFTDTAVYTDLSGLTGDMLNQISFPASQPAMAVEQVRGYTVTRVAGTDGSVAGVFKGQDGSIYAMYVQYPIAFGNRRADFISPLKVLDARAAGGLGDTWSGRVPASMGSFGMRPIAYKGTVLSRADDYTPAAGDFPTGTPASKWSQTVHIRLDVAMLASPTDSIEMQQAFFFDFAPFVGVIRRGQAAVQGAPAPTLDRPLLEMASCELHAPLK